ncbi:MAG TPA: RNA polymerase sigma factor [Polyangiaceae bacterium]|nr:RNA polymerase sigma factor [Polyangiaceae bacterium]
MADHSGQGALELDAGSAVSELPPSIREDAFGADALEDAPGERAGSARQTEPQLGFHQIYEQHFAFVWRSLLLLGVSPASVEDVTQDTFNVVLQKLHQFEGRSAIRTWLFAIAQRVAANHRRMARRKTHPLRPLSDSVVSREPTPHALAEAQECAGVVQRFVASLDAEWRSVFVLAVLEQVPARDVAQSLSIPVNTVYTRVHHLRESLRLAFERHEEAS